MRTEGLAIPTEVLAGHPLVVTAAGPTAGEVFETLTLRAGYNTNLVILGTALLGLSAGVVGVFTMLRKRSLMTDALSHATLPGIVGAFLVAGMLGVQRSLPVLLLGATVSGVLGVLAVQGILRSTRLREDAAIAIVLSVFFGVGVVGLSYVQANAPAGSAGLHGFVFGQAATMRSSDVLLMGVIALVACLGVGLLLKEFALICFNDAFARAEGWSVGGVDLAMMALVVLVTVAGLQAVGLILVVALLIIPAVSARFWSERLWVLVVLAGLFGAGSGYLGSAWSALVPDAPAGPVIVLTSGVVFMASLVLAPARGIAASGVRRLRLQLRIAGDHLLEHAHDHNETLLTRDAVRAVAHERGWSWWFAQVTEWSLRWRGALLVADRSGLTLSEAGVDRGARVARNHALWEQYLVSYADVAPSHVDWSVDLVEHVLEEPLIRELEVSLAARGITVAVGAEDDAKGGLA